MTVGLREERVLYLDGWRGLAILSVLFAHFAFSGGLNMGRFGVELFFVLSGRLMAEMLFVRETPLSRFFPRRFSRVWPALFIFATACLVAAQFGLGDADAGSWLRAITFTSNYMGQSAAGWLQHVWSLCIEEHAYVLLGLVALAHRRWSVAILPILLALIAAAIANGAVQTWVLGRDYYDVFWRTDVRGASILLGAAAFLIAQKGGLRMPVAFGLAGFVLQANFVPDPIKYSLGTACLAWSIATLPSASRWVTDTLSRPQVVFFGTVSYSLYLWQQPFYRLVHELGGGLSVRVALLGAATVIAFASYRLIERPARTFLNSLLERPVAPPIRMRHRA